MEEIRQHFHIQQTGAMLLAIQMAETEVQVVVDRPQDLQM